MPRTRFLGIGSLPIALLAAILLGGASLARGGQFIDAPQYAAGYEPYQVVVADFNLDGKPDLAVGVSGGIGILLGNGDGSFQKPSQFHAQVDGMAVGDFNRDGRPDLALTDANSGLVQVFLGKGDGTFRLVSSTVADHPSVIATGDLNGDGKTDLVMGVEAVFDGTTAVNVLLGNGDGTFQAAVEYPIASRPVWVQIADMNADGKPDVVAVGRGPGGRGTVSVLLGNGDGTLGARLDSSIATLPFSAALADFNGDGKWDVAVINETQNSVGVALGNGDGTFQSLLSFVMGRNPYGLVAADFNGDGKMDLATSNLADNTVSIRLGNGKGTFLPRLDYGAGVNPRRLATGDFNKDGKPDLVVPDYGSELTNKTVSVLLGNGDGTLQASRDFETIGNPFSVGSGDFNGDGRSDLVVGFSSQVSFVSVLLASPNGNFATGKSYATPRIPLEVAVGDFNHDGKLDIVTGNDSLSGGSISVLLGNGDGTFQSHIDVAVSLRPQNIALGDFNNDGNLDVAVGDFNLGIGVLLGNGNGALKFAGTYSVGGNPVGIAVGDVNGDGKLDLAAVQGNLLAILLGNGDGTFQTHVDYDVGSVLRGVALGDFNEDGRLDAVVGIGAVGQTPGSAGVMLGNGDGTFQAAVNYTVGLEPGFITLADFNKDGHLDVAVINRLSCTLSALLGNGDGTLRGHQDYATGSQPEQMVSGDFNGDSYPDLAIANPAGGFGNTVSVLLNKGAGPEK